MYRDDCCIYNRNIVCQDTHKCARCGWDPAVAEARLGKIKAGLKKDREKRTILILHSELPDHEMLQAIRKVWEGISIC